MNRRRLLATGVGATFSLAGCVSIPSSSDEDADPDPDPTAEDLLRAALDARAELNDLTARRTMTGETPEETSERVDRIVQRPPGEQRLEVVDSEGTNADAPPGTVSVRSRAITWEYYPDENLVTERHHPNRVVTDRTRLVLETLLDDDEYVLSYDGVESVDGRDAHRIEATLEDVDEDGADGRSIDLLVGETVYRIPLEETPVDDLEDATVERSIWIHDEYRYPVRERDTVRTEDGELVHRLTVTYEDLALDAGLESGTFTYEPPESAEVVPIGTEPEGIFESHAAAAEAAPYALPEPEVPDPYELDRVTVVDQTHGGTITTLWYADPARSERELFLAVSEDSRFNPDVLEETDVEFDGRPTYYRDGRIESLFWDCGALNYELSSPTADEDVIEIASSVRCPGPG